MRYLTTTITLQKQRKDLETGDVIDRWRETHTIRVEIDEEAILQTIGKKAAWSTRGRSIALGGLIKAKRIGKGGRG